MRTEPLSKASLVLKEPVASVVRFCESDQREMPSDFTYTHTISRTFWLGIRVVSWPRTGVPFMVSAL